MSEVKGQVREALEHAARSCHHPACEANPRRANHKQDRCTCHVGKAMKALAMNAWFPAAAMEMTEPFTTHKDRVVIPQRGRQ